MALIPAFHEVYGWRLIPQQRQQLHPDEWSTYNPAEHNVDDVVAYLETAGPRERARVLDLERSGKQRKTVLEQYSEDDGTPAVEVSAFDPGQNTRDDVVAYLSTASPDERARVLDLERSGKQRKTVLALGDDEPQTPAADGAGESDGPAGDTPGLNQED